MVRISGKALSRCLGSPLRRDAGVISRLQQRPVLGQPLIAVVDRVVESLGVKRLGDPGVQPGHDRVLSDVDWRWIFTEHVGTHLDAPGHVIGGGRLGPEVTPAKLIAPAVVINIHQKSTR
ncbi:MAG: cyclase family protein [Actinomycetota bacterium]